jgi:hypothetical protein
MHRQEQGTGKRNEMKNSMKLTANPGVKTGWGASVHLEPNCRTTEA